MQVPTAVLLAAASLLDTIAEWFRRRAAVGDIEAPDTPTTSATVEPHFPTQSFYGSRCAHCSRSWCCQSCVPQHCGFHAPKLCPTKNQ